MKPDEISDVFNLIGDVADQLLMHIRRDHPELMVNEEFLVDVSRNILEVLRLSGIEGRILIVILLQTAVTMYHVAMTESEKGKAESCPEEETFLN
jgi:hypothetical protein